MFSMESKFYKCSKAPCEYLLHPEQLFLFEITSTISAREGGRNSKTEGGRRVGRKGEKENSILLKPDPIQLQNTL